MPWDDVEIDEDYILMSCPKCDEVLYFGDFVHSKKMCVFCAGDKKNPSDPLVRLVEKTIRPDQCGKA